MSKWTLPFADAVERFALLSDVIDLAKHYNCAFVVPEWPRRYFIQPSEEVPVLIEDNRSRRLGPLRWGWPRERRTQTFARAELAASNGGIARAFRSRRCIVLASAWYLWTGQRGLSSEQRWIIRRVSRTHFGVAALWETVMAADGATTSAFAIISVPATPALRELTQRMPAMIPRECVEQWLSPQTPEGRLRGLVGPYDFNDLEVVRGKRCADDESAMQLEPDGERG